MAGELGRKNLVEHRRYFGFKSRCLIFLGKHGACKVARLHLSRTSFGALNRITSAAGEQNLLRLAFFRFKLYCILLLAISEHVVGAFHGFRIKAF